MIKINKKLFFLVMFELIMLIKSEEVHRKGRDFQGYFGQEEDKYPVPQYPGYYPMSEECEKNPMIPILGKGVNFLLIKLGVIGIVKLVSVLLLLGLLAKLPLILLKFAFIKSFFLPILLTPLLFGIFSPSVKPQTQDSMDSKPGESMPATESMMGMSEMTMDMGRQFTSNLTSVAWQSLRMFAESDQCVERISCIIGASSSDPSFQKLFSRMLKFLHYSSPPSVQERMSLIKEAFYRGSKSLTCSDEDYKCESPQLLVQHGLTRVKIL